MNRLGLGYSAIGWATETAPDDIALLTPAKAKELGVDVTVIDDTDNKQANAQGFSPRPTPREPGDRAPQIQAIDFVLPVGRPTPQ